MRVEQGVTDHEPVCGLRKEILTLKHNPSNMVDAVRDRIHPEIVEVFVPPRIIDPTRVFVDAQIEFRIMLNDRFIEIGKQDMIVIIQGWLRHHEQSVVFPGMASYYIAAGVSPGPVCTDQLPA